MLENSVTYLFYFLGIVVSIAFVFTGWKTKGKTKKILTITSVLLLLFLGYCNKEIDDNHQHEVKLKNDSLVATSRATNEKLDSFIGIYNNEKIYNKQFQ